MPSGTSQFSVFPLEEKVAGKRTTTSSLSRSTAQCAFESVAIAAT
jgi:hypothetical protein